MSDNQISDGEFQLIMAEFSQYNALKEAVRSKITRNSSVPDIEKIKKNVRSEIEAEFQKKINTLVLIHGFICISLRHDCLFPLGRFCCQ